MSKPYLLKPKRVTCKSIQVTSFHKARIILNHYKQKSKFGYSDVAIELTELPDNTYNIYVEYILKD